SYCRVSRRDACAMSLLSLGLTTRIPLRTPSRYLNTWSLKSFQCLLVRNSDIPGRLPRSFSHARNIDSNSFFTSAMYMLSSWALVMAVVDVRYAPVVFSSACMAYQRATGDSDRRRAMAVLPRLSRIPWNTFVFDRESDRICRRDSSSGLALVPASAWRRIRRTDSRTSLDGMKSR